MSWEVALIAASTAVQVGTSVMEGRQNAKMAQQQAQYNADSLAIEAEQGEENVRLIRLQTQQEEERRRREFAIVEAENMANVSYDPYGSPSFMAAKKENKRMLDLDLSNLSLMGGIQEKRAKLGVKNALQSAQNEISLGSQRASNYRRSGYFSATRSLLSGSQKIHAIKKPKSE